ncbi:hypothetical protein K4F52_009757 [Lecanicillium sp. MT-2017a]|nr:hypothetical protein K4F52_009757 [Lecanicillium sp. MT-2017a]
MPRKFKTPESNAQNRESQRRSRARRRELIDDLTRQIEEYKRRGIEASLHMQRAARAVLAENRRLRALLYQYGISPDEANGNFSTPGRRPASGLAFKGGMAEEIRAPEPRSTQDTSKSPAVAHDSPLRQEVSLSPESLAMPTDKGCRAVRMSSAATPTPPTPPCHHGHGEAEGQEGEKERCQPSNYTGHDDLEQIASCVDGLEYGIPVAASDCFCPPGPPTRSTYRTETLQTSCEAAAAILIDLQSQDDLASARTALGCMGASSCSVKNTTIFRLMDEFK